jgi:molybdate/tungstate transport system substrate-binding protein
MSVETQRSVVSNAEQRFRAGDTRPRSRRGYLGALAGAAGLAGSAVLAGCLGAGGDAVSVLSAGSLAQTFEAFVGPAFEDETGVAVHGEYHGSNAAMRLIEAGTEHPDVVVSADATLLRDRLYGSFTDWDVEFAGNSVGLAYREGTTFAARLHDGTPWYELARNADEGDIAISDPNLDPLGYRAMQAFELAERFHGLEGFREQMATRVYTEPSEPRLLAGIESGARVAAVAYRNMAVDRGLAFEAFPAAYSFGDPDLADHYATVQFTTDDGYTATGRPVVYSTTVNSEADSRESGFRLVQFLLDNPELMVEAGLTVGESLPRSAGEPPARLNL